MQGAPLAPIYHQAILAQIKSKLPSCIINIGGVSNLTYYDNKNLIGFDTDQEMVLLIGKEKNSTSL